MIATLDVPADSDSRPALTSDRPLVPNVVCTRPPVLDVSRFDDDPSDSTPPDADIDTVAPTIAVVEDEYRDCVPVEARYWLVLTIDIPPAE